MIAPKAVESAVVAKKGGFTSVKIPQHLLEKRLALCSNSLIGRLVLQKGDSPYKISFLKERLNAVWGLREAWRLISLGKGYYHLLLPSQAAKLKILNMGTLGLKPCVFRIQPWQPDFNLADKSLHELLFGLAFLACLGSIMMRLYWLVLPKE